MCDIFCRRLQHLYHLCHGNQIPSGHILCVLHFLIWLQYSCYIHFSLILLFLSVLHLLLLLSHCHLDNYVPPLQVKWAGELSESFDILQGVRQEGILSTHLYKIFVQDLLLELESQCLGFQLGDIYIGTSTCADDIAFM